MTQKRKSKSRRKPSAQEKEKMMAEDAFELGEAALDKVEGAAVAPTATAPPPPSTSASQQRPPPPIDVLSYDDLVTIFLALDDPDFVRRTIPLVCRGWAELYRSEPASPLHETLKVNFEKEAKRAVEAGGKGAPPLVHASRVISWAERRAGSVRKLYISRVEEGAVKDFSFKEMGRLVAAAGPSLTDLYFDFNLYVQSQVRSELRRRRGGFYVLPDLKPLWKAVRDSVAPAGRLRSLGVRGADFFPESDLGRTLGQLAGSLEELLLSPFDVDDSRYPSPGDPGVPRRGVGLTRFPEFLCDLTELRSLYLPDHRKIEAIPASISSLKKLKGLDLSGCRVSSLPKELGELPRLEALDLTRNPLGHHTQEDVASSFPAELANMESLRGIRLVGCGLRAVPAFVAELASLEALDLSDNDKLGDAPQQRAFPAALWKSNKSLRDVNLHYCGLRAVPAFVGDLESLESLDLSDNGKLGDTPQHRAFPAALGRMKSLTYLNLLGCGLRALPALFGELESLEVLVLSENKNLGNAPFPAALGKIKSLRVLALKNCGLRAVPAFLGELASLEVLNLSENKNFGDAPFPAALKKMKSLKELRLGFCDLRTFPAFIAELESLEVLDLGYNDFEVDAAALAALLRRCRSLREVTLSKSSGPWTAASLANLAAFKAKLLAENPAAKISYEFSYKSSHGPFDFNEIMNVLAQQRGQ